MPVQYGSIVAEHQATRTAVGLFDISHMGRLSFAGTGAVALLDSLVTRRVDDMSPGQVRYGLVTNESGGILDDVLVYRLFETNAGPFDSERSRPTYLMVVNASNRAKILAWIQGKMCDCPGVEMFDLTGDLAMVAVQGPKALETLAKFVAADLSGMKYYHCQQTQIDGVPGIVSRTGYTGEDGFEVILAASKASGQWEKLLDAGKTYGAQACGLGCRDTLRLEAAMPLYGHELSEEITPWQAGLNFAVDVEGRNFFGREALAKIQHSPPQRVRVGLELSGKRVPREHYAILAGGKQVGEVTSGTFSPTLNKPIAMGYVQAAHAAVGTELAIDVRGSAEQARVVKLPFYRRAKK
jgi:aminomethyltransferase